MDRCGRWLLVVVSCWAMGCGGGGTKHAVLDVSEEDWLADDGTSHDLQTETTSEIVPDVHRPDVCAPSCAGRECGTDGCGGTCGTCPQAAPICVEGMCEVECIPTCEGRECGDDDCGGVCGNCPLAAPFCVERRCAVTCDIDCDGKECGPDGCGGECGTCQPGWECRQGICGCTPQCEGKECGLDGCGGRCGTCTEEAPFCVNGTCVADCQPDCTGKTCGNDGCGGSCGTCQAPSVCQQGNCVCVPDCPTGKCGNDGCGGTCPDCGCGQQCQQGTCVDVACMGKSCGSNGCGGTCGICGAGFQCSTQGECLNSCDLACVGKQCGLDGCGGVCGLCPAGSVCTDAGQCVTTCVPNCTGKVCGPDGCGGSCGTCSPLSGKYCHAGQCVSECVPNCGVKVCGPNGCGGTCGTCTSPLICTTAGTCGSHCSQCSYQPDCFLLDFSNGTLAEWSVQNAYLISHLGVTQAPTGSHMLMLTTQGNSLELDARATYQNCLPSGNYMLKIRWKLYSEEFKEYCNSQFQDSFTVRLKTAQQEIPLATFAIDDLCPASASCSSCGTNYNNLTLSDVHFDQGDAWHTDWFESSFPMTLAGPDTRFSVIVGLRDAGDGIYDSVALVDSIQFQPCTSTCAPGACGVNACGVNCGSCPGGGVCLNNLCCQPSCAGKDCGSNGCGGSCGVCGSLSQCVDGVCECRYQECSDGCCPQGDVCSASSGKCCAPQCGLQFYCQPDGCGNLCPGPDGKPCCQNHAQCNDNNPCTIDTCVNSSCGYQAVVSPECCTPLNWQENFDDGLADGFTLQNSGAIFPGLETGWQVSSTCGSHSPSYSLYYGMNSSLFGTCVYDMALPMPFPTSGTATTPALVLPAGASNVSFWVQADIRASSSVDHLALRLVHGAGSVSLWTKANLPSVGTTWRSVSLPVNGYAGQTVQFQFYFDVVSSATEGNSLTGVRIDGLKVTGSCGP